MKLRQQRPSGGFFYRLKIKLIFKNSGISQDYVKSQTKGCVNYYANNFEQISKFVPPGFTCQPVNADSIMSSCQITGSQPKLSSYSVTMKKVLVLTCGCQSAAHIEITLKNLANIVYINFYLI